MEASETDMIKGMLLDRWIEDLCQDKAPRVIPEMKFLTAREIAEVMQLARWFKASLYSTEGPGIDDEEKIAGIVRRKVFQEHDSLLRMATKIAEKAANFSALLRETRELRQIEVRDLERALSVPNDIINRLESGSLSPHRIPIDKMVALLYGLQLASNRVVELIRKASLDWAQATYTQPQSQLGRLDASLSDDERRRLLEAGATDDMETLRNEIDQIERYCRLLSARFT